MTLAMWFWAAVAVFIFGFTCWAIGYWCGLRDEGKQQQRWRNLQNSNTGNFNVRNYPNRN